jgi:hypothetical protein
MSFLLLSDYYNIIRQDKLDVILKNNDTIRQDKEKDVEEMVKNYIRHRYDVDKIFIDVLEYSNSTKYFAGDVLSYSEPTYDLAATYIAGDRVSYSITDANNVTLTYIYENLVGSTGIAPDDDDVTWQQIVLNETLYTNVVPSIGNLPTSALGYSTNDYTDRHKNILGWDRLTYGTIYFKREDTVIKIYISSADRSAGINEVGYITYDPLPSALPSSRPILQGQNNDVKFSGYLTIKNFIDDAQEWDVTATGYFEQKDSRSRIIKHYCISIAVYELHKLINPRNIPEVRIVSRDEAIEDLKMIQRGVLTPDLPTYETEPERGQEISYGNTSSDSYYY